MIHGIGVDVIDMERMKSVLERWGEAILRKLFTSVEIAYCSAKKNPHEHFAARFAAKEAVSKAMQTGWQGKFRWQDVEVANEPSGAPIVVVRGDVAKTLNDYRIHLSLSHSANTVVAFAVIERKS